MAISYKQIKTIYVCLKEVKKDNEFLHDNMPAWVGKSSVKDLSTNDVTVVIRNLKKVGEATPIVSGSPTSGQLYAIKRLSEDLEYSPEQLSGFILRTTKNKTTVETLTFTDASAVIAGLRRAYHFYKSKKQKSQL